MQTEFNTFVAVHVNGKYVWEGRAKEAKAGCTADLLTALRKCAKEFSVRKYYDGERSRYCEEHHFKI